MSEKNYLQAIKTYLDSGCEVEIEMSIEKYDTNRIDVITGSNEISWWYMFHCRELAMTYLNDTKEFYLFWMPVDILSIKPIGKPLYEYKVGDKIQYLKSWHIGTYEISEAQVQATNEIIDVHMIKLENWLYPIDIRQIAPLVDNLNSKW